MPALNYRPLTQWPAGRKRTASFAQRSATFKAPWDLTQRELAREIDRADGASAVLQVDIANPRDIRGDGSLIGRAQMNTSAVVLIFEKSIHDERRGQITVPVTIACDAFDEWRDNVRAIMLGLRDLRRLDRYGIVQQGEQYRGFAALPSTTVPAMNTEQAADALAKRAGGMPPATLLNLGLEYARTVYRTARMKAHPDSGGSSAEFNIVQEAARVLAIHHGVEKL